MTVFLAASLVRPIGDPDIGWHIAAGRWALAHHQLPQLDYWNKFAVDKPWVPYSWLSELVFAAAEASFGWTGLLGVSFLFALILTASFAGALSALAGDAVLGSVLAALAVAGCQDHFDLRPQSLTWALFAMSLAIGRWAKEKSGGTPLVCFFLVCAVWANVHITVIFGLLAAGVWCWTANNPPRSLSLMLAGLLGSMLTPHLGGEWLVAFKKVDHPFVYSIITEFQPATIWYPSAAVVVLGFALLSVLYAESSRTYPLHCFLFTGIFVVLGFAVQKFIPFAAILIPACIAGIWRSHAPADRRSRPLTYAIEACARGAEVVAAKGALAVVLLTAGLGVLHLLQVFRHPVDRLAFPVAATDHIRQYRLPSNILNDFSDGGYLIYRYLREDGTPEALFPLDGRTNVNDPKIMAEYVNTVFGNARWADYFKSVQPAVVLWRNRYALPSILLASDGWCRTYSDATEKSPMRGWSVFVLRGAHPLCPGDSSQTRALFGK